MEVKKVAEEWEIWEMALVFFVRKKDGKKWMVQDY